MRTQACAHRDTSVRTQAGAHQHAHASMRRSMRTQAYAHMGTGMRTRACAHEDAHTWTQACAHEHAHKSICTQACAHEHAHTSMRTQARVEVHWRLAVRGLCARFARGSASEQQMLISQQSGGDQYGVVSMVATGTTLFSLQTTRVNWDRAVVLLSRVRLFLFNQKRQMTRGAHRSTKS